MGCIWSHEEQGRCRRCGRKLLENSLYCRTCNANISSSCPPYTHKNCVNEARPAAASAYPEKNKRPNLKAYFGEYRCACGRRWNSRLSWADRYQICKRCKRNVFPHFQRELKSSDLTKSTENRADHPKELCQMCQQLGRYCGRVNF